MLPTSRLTIDSHPYVSEATSTSPQLFVQPHKHTSRYKHQQWQHHHHPTPLRLTMSISTPIPNPGPHELAQQIISHQNPSYSFSFSPFLLTTQRFGIPHTRPPCKAYLQGHCPMGSACPDRHIAQSSNSNFNNLVCKHWLRGLCKKGESCEFLHEYNLRKMPECNFFVRNGYCSNGGMYLSRHVLRGFVIFIRCCTLPEWMLMTSNYRRMPIPPHRP
jgi:hypothetical protein